MRSGDYKMKYTDLDEQIHSYIVVYHDDSEKIIKGSYFECALESEGLQFSDIKEAYGVTFLWSE